MSYRGLIRLAGVSAALGGVLLLATDVIGLLVVQPAQGVILTQPRGSWAAAFLLGLVLTLGGLVGVYARQAPSAGVLGFLGFAAAFSGTALSAGIAWAPLVAPSLTTGASHVAESTWVGLAESTWVVLVLAFVGWALLGVATMRAGVFPRTAAVALLLGAVLSFLAFAPLLPGTLVLDAAIAWMGVALLSGRAAPAGRPARAR